MNRLICAMAIGCALLSNAGAGGQQLDERLDQQRYLRGLTDLQLPEVLEHYIQMHPPQTPAKSAEFQMASHRMALKLAGRSVPKRLEHIEAILQVRQDLINSEPDHPDLAIWLGDQATDCLFDLLSIEAAGLTSLFGIPDQEQAARAGRVAHQTHSLMKRAAEVVDHAILQLEADRNFASDMSLQRKHRHLSEVQRDRRIPFLQGLGDFLHAELNVKTAGDRQRLYQDAYYGLSEVVEELNGVLAARARLYAGLAASRLADLDQAVMLLQQVANDDAANRGDEFAARAGLLQIRALQAGNPAAIEGLANLRSRYSQPKDLFYQVLMADMAFKWANEMARRSASGIPGLVKAYRGYVDLLEFEQVSKATLETIVFERLVRVAGDRAPLDQLPPVVSLARADQLSETEATRESAIDLFLEVLQRGDLSERDRAVGHYGVAAALLEAGRSRDAADHLVTLAEDHPSHHQAERAIETAAKILVRAYRKDGKDKWARDMLQRTLGVLLSRYINLPSVDRWRYESGRLAMNEGEYDQAERQFRQVARTAGEWIDSQFMLANSKRTRATTTTIGDRAAYWSESLMESERIRGLLEPLLEPTGQSLSAGDLKKLRYYIGYLRVFEAEAYLGLGRAHRAVAVLEGIEQQVDDGVVIAAALQARIDAYQELGDADKARREVRSVLAAAPDLVPRVVPPMMNALQRDIEKLIDQSRPAEAQDQAAEQLGPLADLLMEWLGSQSMVSSKQETLIRKRVGDAYRLSGRPQDAMGQYDWLLDSHPDALPILIGRAECLYVQGVDSMDEAMRIYKRVVASGYEATRDAYWLSQLRQLQILDQVGRNTQKIAPHIERLRQEDPDLGGERFRRQFDLLQSKYL